MATPTTSPTPSPASSSSDSTSRASTVLDTRLRRLAYAPEIAGEMLRRQQAAAVVAARQLIVQGALSMVEGALRNLEEADIIRLTPDQRANLVSNLLVVLVSDRGAQPIVNSGAD